MTLPEKILQHVQNLPASLQAEILDYVEYLELKAEKDKEGLDEKDWATLSLSFAMRGIEDEYSPYTQYDLKEIFS